MSSFEASLRIDASKFADDATAHAIAIAIAEETEALRAAQRAAEPPVQAEESGLGLLGTLYVYRRSEVAPWYEFAEAPEVVVRCAKRLDMPASKFALAIAEKLRPPNWGVYFWMGNYFDAMHDNMESMKLALWRHEQAGAAAVARHIREMASQAGVASGAKRRAKAKATPEKVRRTWDEVSKSRPPRAIANVVATRLEVDPSYVRKQKKKRD